MNGAPAPDTGPAEAFWRDPALPFAESRRASRSRACYRPHLHPTFSIGAVDGGRSVFTGAERGPVPLRAGMLVFVPAGRVHACNPAPGSAWSYQMLHLDAAWLQAVRSEAAAAVPEGGGPVRIVDDPACHARFARLNALLFSPAAPQDKEAALIEFIGDSDAVHGLSIPSPGAGPHLRERLRPAMERLRDAPADSAPLDELARLAGMGRYQLIRAFKAATGMTPHAWQMNLRINCARARLRGGDSLADVAHGLGFADQAHFQRMFKAHAGVTPGRFRV
ncbi:helix-turn-helix transcriptional regulator [Paracidovorax avenae]|uniref:helix-turn-helix transcriptional regulator n=1 Tax=Paracidovorax avenae TaxID=80867 RepID=UPI000D1541E2|nr:AraC family transcriptional regulator [Paracidovorax avenae]AVS88284.1 AraC family transcriptional regulator [Paracidovorax avenae]AVS95800.1 AraC family transcriptional regulator [Paracidovorax avenae]AVT02485.1 AraC family transcriptional regulator [Paracidovorax avenae]AVT05928.1 AraC family transcriptional regulator [Paracidovorax avenae]AVT09325.1 AraC family transcriptional regulator [Paracidovorax avenae]